MNSFRAMLAENGGWIVAEDSRESGLISRTIGAFTKPADMIEFLAKELGVNIAIALDEAKLAEASTDLSPAVAAFMALNPDEGWEPNRGRDPRIENLIEVALAEGSLLSGRASETLHWSPSGQRQLGEAGPDILAWRVRSSIVSYAEPKFPLRIEHYVDLQGKLLPRVADFMAKNTVGWIPNFGARPALSQYLEIASADGQVVFLDREAAKARMWHFNRVEMRGEDLFPGSILAWRPVSSPKAAKGSEGVSW